MNIPLERVILETDAPYFIPFAVSQNEQFLKQQDHLTENLLRSLSPFFGVLKLTL